MSIEPTEINEYGVKTWKNKFGQIHRGGDLPAIIWRNGACEWVRNGKNHRDHNLPATIGVNGFCQWFQNGKRIKCNYCTPEEIKQFKKPYQGNNYRPKGKISDKPTIVTEGGIQIWTNFDGNYHRDHDLPAWIEPNGHCEWYQNNYYIKQRQCTPEEVEEFRKPYRNK